MASCLPTWKYVRAHLRAGTLVTSRESSKLWSKRSASFGRTLVFHKRKQHVYMLEQCGACFFSGTLPLASTALLLFGPWASTVSPPFPGPPALQKVKHPNRHRTMRPHGRPRSLERRFFRTIPIALQRCSTEGLIVVRLDGPATAGGHSWPTKTNSSQRGGGCRGSPKEMGAEHVHFSQAITLASGAQSCWLEGRGRGSQGPRVAVKAHHPSARNVNVGFVPSKKVLNGSLAFASLGGNTGRRGLWPVGGTI